MDKWLKCHSITKVTILVIQESQLSLQNKILSPKLSSANEDTSRNLGQKIKDSEWLCIFIIWYSCALITHERTFNKLDSTLKYSGNLHFKITFYLNEDPKKLGASELNSVKAIKLNYYADVTVLLSFPSFFQYICSYHIWFFCHYDVWSVDWCEWKIKDFSIRLQHKMLGKWRVLNIYLVQWQMPTEVKPSHYLILLYSRFKKSPDWLKTAWFFTQCTKIYWLMKVSVS